MTRQIVLTRDQVRQIDRIAIEQIGIPGVVLMENAGRHAAQTVLELLPNPAGARVCVLCGPGNNGGDGFVVARHLHNAEVRVTVLLACDAQKITGDARVNYDIAQRMSLPMHAILTPDELAQTQAQLRDCDVIVDALLGTGFTGQPRPPIDQIIRAVNALRGPTIVAIDVPSGLDCDTGQPADPCVRADVTVTFVAPKAGFEKPPAPRYLGRIVVADIGVPRDLLRPDEKSQGKR
jgi:NAD(P)H-hydrate epimerase